MSQLYTSPVHKLSDDILVMIFYHFPAGPTGNTPLSMSGSAPEPPVAGFTWMYITHVCRRWRSVFASCATLWACISFNPPSWTPVFLERAQQVPLVISVDWSRDASRHPIDDVVSLALGHLCHTRSLRLCSPSVGFVSSFTSLLKGQTADMLRTLCLENRMDVVPSLAAPGSPLLLPDQLFARPPPQLRQLYIKGNILFTWQNELFSSHLTHLYLMGLASTSLPTMDQLLICLGACPLETLVLEYSLPILSSRAALAPLPQDFMRVGIPTLAVFRIAGHSIEVADVVRRLRLSADCYIDIENRHVAPTAPTAAALRALTTEVDAVLLNRSALPSRGLDIKHLDHNQCVWKLTTIKPPLRAAGERISAFANTAIVSLQSGPDSATRTPEEIRRHAILFANAFVSVMRLYPLGSLVEMDIASVSVYLVRRNIWLGMMRELRCLKFLRVQGRCCYAFGSAFSLLSDDRQVLPCLEELWICQAHLSYPIGPAGLAIELESALVKRNRNGAPALRLELQRCRVLPAQLQKLEEMTGDAVVVIGEPDTCGVGEEVVETPQTNEDAVQDEGPVNVDG